MKCIVLLDLTDLATELFSTSCGARKLAGLHLPEAVRESCKGRISPCSLVLALLYLERLKTGGEIAADYLSDVTPSELFIVSMVSKILVYVKLPVCIAVVHMQCTV